MRNHKAVKFTAVSPTTGKTFSRKSTHAYTHAVVSRETTDSIARGYERNASHAWANALRYEQIAKHLKNGTTPEAGSVLLSKARSMSLNMMDAGVRTEWDSVMYDQKEGCKHTVEQYEEWARDSYVSSERAAHRAEEAREKLEIAERVTFHHSEALAQKQVAANEAMAVKCSRAFVQHIVPVN